MRLTLLHTASVHVATFDALRDRIAPGAVLNHVVHEDWLAEAQEEGVSTDLEVRLGDAVTAANGPVICTCTTLGPAAARQGAIRIDAPMMEAAVAIGGAVVMAYALTSTKAPSRDLFLASGGVADDLRMLDLSAHWLLFEDGQTGAFHQALADAIRADHTARGGDVVVLAQASMAGAAGLLADLGVPVLCSPEMALRAGLQGSGTTG
jgi:hypothetical protein